MIAHAPHDLDALIRLRHALHMTPDLSGQEARTVQTLLEALRPTSPDRIVTGLGGHGLAVVYEGARAGPSVMLRAELDALPITEASGRPHRSRVTGVAHLCGHDGHMTALAGVGRSLSAQRPERGRVILLFQPAEETGAGAQAVLADPAFHALAPDIGFALHVMPGIARGAVAVAPGPASCASVGLRIELDGREAHAATPETGQSPARALRAILTALDAHAIPSPMGPEFKLATLCHLQMGAPSFGIAPGRLAAHVTLRSRDDPVLDALEHEIIRVTRGAAEAHATRIAITRHDPFAATVNDPGAARIIAAACTDVGVPLAEYRFPMRASEDFGAFGQHMPIALFFLGAGREQPGLHDPNFDFPDALLAPAHAVYMQILARALDA